MTTTWRILTTLGFSCGLLTALGADGPLKPADLRAKAKELLGPLPDKMPGSEHDTPALIELGRQLYFEKKLSMNNSQSCNTCHVVDQGGGGVDNEPTSEGAFKKRGDRNSPTTLNAGFHFVQFWDGRASNLVEQAKGPVLNPVEMAMPNEVEVVKRLSADKAYPALFAKAFPDASEKITYENMAKAIAAFERTLITRDRFDDFQKGDDGALTAKELEGLNLFLTAGCTTCHFSPVLGGTTYQKVGLVHPYETPDQGRAKISKDEDDQYKFKVPSLRNIALTAPYFHDGSQKTLKESVTKMAFIQLDRRLTEAEADALVAFLHSLTDKARATKK